MEAFFPGTATRTGLEVKPSGLEDFPERAL
jgi:hypothetical protein